MTDNNTTTARIGKPAKPYDGFPLFAHQNGQWAKKIHGRLYYFGAWQDWQASLQRYLDEKDALHAGRTPRARTDGLTLRDLMNHFLTAKEMQRDSGELQPKSFLDYRRTCGKIKDAFGLDRHVDDLRPEDFTSYRAKLASQLGPVALWNDICRTRVLFNWAFDNGHIDKPVRYGTEFKKPHVRILRKAKETGPLRFFEAADIRKMIEQAPPNLKAMILLGINGAIGNLDIADMPIRAVNLDTGWMNYPRGKTGIARRCPLWPETVQAIRDTLTGRKTPANEMDQDILFMNEYGQRYVRGTHIDGLGQEFRKLLIQLGIRRKQVGFYSLRHTFRTIAGETGDERAIDMVMGHKRDSDMANTYTHVISDERLRKVTAFVRDWLFAEDRKQQDSPSAAKEVAQ